MNRFIIAGLSAVFSMSAIADGEFPIVYANPTVGYGYTDSPLNIEMLGKISRRLPLMRYTGFTATNQPCRIEIARTPGFYPGTLRSFYMTGYDPFPTSVPTNIWRASGYFQLVSTTMAQVTSWQESPAVLQVAVLVAPRFPNVEGFGTWEGNLIIQSDNNGAPTSVRIEERAYDPGSNQTSTREYVCGARNQGFMQ